MRREEHVTIGLITGGIIGMMVGNMESIEAISNIIIASILGGFGALLPDSLEPATSWRHRQFYHSQKVLMRLTIGLVIIITFAPLWSEEPFGYVILGTVSGYISHLLADATTPMRLPR